MDEGDSYSKGNKFKKKMIVAIIIVFFLAGLFLYQARNEKDHVEVLMEKKSELSAPSLDERKDILQLMNARSESFPQQ